MTIHKETGIENKSAKRAQASPNHTFAYSGRFSCEALPKYEIPQKSTDPNCVYQIIHDELELDATPALNLATFVTNWMEPQANTLLLESANKNFADMSCYTQTAEIEERCVSMLANLWHSPATNGHSVGTYCVGSSEACMLAALAMKKKWQRERKDKGKEHYHPNMVMASTVQVVWKKFCAYFDVEPRLAKISDTKFDSDNQAMIDLCDENTIGIVSLLGSTYTGHFDDVEDLNDKLVKFNKSKGFKIGIHVDAATGGFIAPFIYPELKWDFRLSEVWSINTSGHKYGLVYPGVGFVVWRDSTYLPDEIVFDLHYLGGTEKTFTLNFSKPSSQVILQYYNFLRLGMDGYTRVIEDCRSNADYLAEEIGKLPEFKIISSSNGTPLVTCLLNNVKEYTVYDLEHKLKEFGWIIPAYQLADGAEHLNILRMVVRESFTKDLAAKFIEALKRSMAYLDMKYKESHHDNPQKPNKKRAHKAHNVC